MRLQDEHYEQIIEAVWDAINIDENGKPVLDWPRAMRYLKNTLSQIIKPEFPKSKE
jgi:hypothetical protein